MKLIGSWSAKLALLFAVAVALITILQARATENRRFNNPVHMSVDWSNRHIRYSGAGTAAQSWKLYGNPRFQRHLFMMSRGGRRVGVEAWHRPRLGFAGPLKRDWQMPLDANATTGDWHNNGGFYASPAKFTFDINATPSCTNDFVAFPTNLPGVTNGASSIVAMNQLYSGTIGLGTGICGGGLPSVMWAYNTNLAGDAGGRVMSSPALSLDGTRIVYVETAATGGALLKILQWQAGQGTIGTAAAPTQLMNSGDNWSACTPGNSCLFTLSLGTAQDTGSSPFVDYLNDSLYVGDDAGFLHKFTGVFNGTPAEVTVGWPISVSTGKLTSPVFDEVSGNIYVADNFFLLTPSASSLFYVQDTASTVGTCASGTPPCKGSTVLAVTNVSQGVFDPPIVDPITQKVYVFVGMDNSNGFASVYQTTTALGSTVNTELGEPLSGVPFAGDVTAAGYGGAFDSKYRAGNYASSFMYVCGTKPTTLYRIGFDISGVMNPAVDPASFRIQQATPAKPAANCSPMTEILNGSNDFIFFGFPYDVTFLLNGGIVSLNVATSPWPPSGANFSALPEFFGPSGIVVDNVGTGGEEASIYFTPQNGLVTCGTVTTPTVGCAVKATQLGLN